MAYEPEAYETARAALEGSAGAETLDRTIQSSIAISLKRIADFIDGPDRLNIVEYLAQEFRRDFQ